ncbi:MAG TPA: hypothetical protein VEB39_06050 [Sphingomicrobium sp.]|nr:hypothetical protein [Sphingomicrobium sp.]
MLSLTLLIQAASAAAQQPLYLTCFGGGTANKLAVSSAQTNANIYGSVGTTPYSGYGNATTNIYSQRQQGFEDQVDIRLFAGDDRIRMPRTMLPPIRGGEGGWFKLKKVEADSRSIRASAAVNFMNNPKVHIDRVTGSISISGKAGDYSGQCQIVDAEAKPKF